MELHRTLLPAPGRPGDDRPPPTTFTPPPKRQQTAVACEQCRRRKVKCDGRRPVCVNCSKKDFQCEYTVDPGVSRRQGQAQRQEALEREIAQLRELFGYIRTRSETESQYIVQRIRHASEDPLDTLHMVQTGEALTMLYQAHPQRQLQIDQEALEASVHKLKAQPWTGVAGDGIVSELISLFVDWEAPFHCPFIDTDAFLSDMKAGSLETSRCCSPMLVNAMCALSCFINDRIDELDGPVRWSFGRRFFDAAEDNFHQQGGKATLPTVQALLIMFLYGSATGRDKDCAMYRLTACSMLRVLGLEGKCSPRARAPEKKSKDSPAMVRQAQARIASKALWGFFCTETFIACGYNRQSLVPPPSIILSSSDGPTSVAMGSQKALNEGDDLLKAECELTKIVYEIMQYTCHEMAHEYDAAVGDQVDLKRRTELYLRLTKWEKILPDRVSINQSSKRGIHYLREYYHVAAITLLRPLLLRTDVQHIDGFPPPRKKCMDHIEEIILDLDEIDRSHGLSTSSMWQVWPPFVCAYALVVQLGKQLDLRVPELFTKACAVMRIQAKRWPIAIYWLHGLRCYAKQIGVQENVPDAALPSFSGLEELGVDLKGPVAVGFSLPMQEELAELASDDDAADVAIGKLIAKFNASTLGT